MYLNGITVSKQLVIGTVANWQGSKALSRKTHKWSVYVRGIANEDLSYLIERCVFYLHEDFKKPVRTVKEGLFEVTEIGWGEFDIPICIYFHEYVEPLSVTISLKLFQNEAKRPSKSTVKNEKFVEAVFRNPPIKLYKRVLVGPHCVFPETHTLSTTRKYTTAQEFALNEQKTVETILKKHAVLLEKVKKKKERYWQLDQLMSEELKKKQDREPKKSQPKNVLMNTSEASPLKPPITFSQPEGSVKMTQPTPQPMQIQQQPRQVRPTTHTQAQMQHHYHQMQLYQQMMMRNNPSMRHQWQAMHAQRQQQQQMQGFDPSQRQQQH